MTNEKQVLIEAIVRVDNEIKDTKNKLRDRRADVKQMIEELPEFAQLQEIMEQVVAAKNELKGAIAADKDVQVAAADVEDIAFKLRDLKEILSHHLVAYYEETGKKFIIEGVDDRPIILSAKLGKREPHQESMFDESNSKVTIKAVQS